MQLSKIQEEIVNHDAGALLVEACAGSGKTRVLTERIRRLLTQERGNFSILALTFTNKAAEEMQNRLKDVKGIKDRAFIGTIHSFAMDLISHKKHIIGLKQMPHIFSEIKDRQEILTEAIEKNVFLFQNYLKKEPKEQTNFVNQKLEIISNIKKSLFHFDNQAQPIITEYEDYDLFENYNLILQDQNAIDYDDILLYAQRILSTPTVSDLYRRIYKYILIDEAQDLNDSQYQLIKTLCGTTFNNIMMVGDTKQSLYQFNYADIKIMEKYFVQDFGAERIKMKQNFRSAKQIINFANTLNPNSFDGQYAVFEGEAKVYNFIDDEQEASWVVQKIKELLAEKENPRTEIIGQEKFELIDGGISLSKIAILARNRYVFTVLKQKLEQDEELKNNFFLKESNTKLEFETDLLKLFDLGIVIITNPADNSHFNQLKNLLKITNPVVSKYNKISIERLIELESSISEEFKQPFTILLNVWQKLVKSETLIPQSLDILAEYAKVQTDENYRILLNEDIDYYKKIWANYLRKTNNISLSDFRRNIALGTILETKKEKELTLSTIHAAKGLEFEIVFIIGMTEGTLPDFRAKNIEEEKNNAHVAITRAKKILYISYPKKQKGYIKQKSRFLDGFEIELVSK
jgi:DNA helicase-2/ATP-dependent DNA helicase PcrA